MASNGEEVGSMVVVARLDNESMISSLNKLKSSLRETRSEASGFFDFLSKIGKIAGVGLGAGAALVGGATAFSQGPNTQIAMTQLGVWINRARREADRQVGPGIRAGVESFAKNVSPEGVIQDAKKAVDTVIGGAKAVLDFTTQGPLSTAGIIKSLKTPAAAKVDPNVLSDTLKRVQNQVDQTSTTVPDNSNIQQFDFNKPYITPAAGYGQGLATVNVKQINLNIKDFIS